MNQLLGYTTAQSPFRTSLSDFIHSCPTGNVEPGYVCLDCGNSAPKPTLNRGRIRLQQCGECGAYVCSDKTLHQLVHHYGSIFGKLKKRIKPISKLRKDLRVLIKGNKFDRRKKVACFDLTTFNEALEEMSCNVITQTEKKWWCVWKCGKN
jgi:hypothetical protein